MQIYSKIYAEMQRAENTSAPWRTGDRAVLTASWVELRLHGLVAPLQGQSRTGGRAGSSETGHACSPGAGQRSPASGSAITEPETATLSSQGRRWADPTSAFLLRSTRGGHRADLAPKIAETSGHWTQRWTPSYVGGVRICFTLKNDPGRQIPKCDAKRERFRGYWETSLQLLSVGGLLIQFTKQ